MLVFAAVVRPLDGRSAIGFGTAGNIDDLTGGSIFQLKITRSVVNDLPVLTSPTAIGPLLDNGSICR
ncbi:MAG: hypothetical protein K0Q73_1745 [Paenibacillus sp.]|nr:hypothetical protein [Paenibacillus sp.]